MSSVKDMGMFSIAKLVSDVGTSVGKTISSVAGAGMSSTVKQPAKIGKPKASTTVKTVKSTPATSVPVKSAPVKVTVKASPSTVKNQPAAAVLVVADDAESKGLVNNNAPVKISLWDKVKAKYEDAVEWVKEKKSRVWLVGGGALALIALVWYFLKGGKNGGKRH